MGNSIAVYMLTTWQSSGLFKIYISSDNSSHAASTLDFPRSNSGQAKRVLAGACPTVWSSHMGIHTHGWSSHWDLE